MKVSWLPPTLLVELLPRARVRMFVTATGASQVAGSPQTEQLTTTLTAANGPPASTVEQSLQTVSSSTHYTGLRLNGIPLGNESSSNRWAAF